MSRLYQEIVTTFQEKILTWYERHKRDLPWRRTRDPYKILVSEIMLQQTQVRRVVPKYDAWVTVLPTVHELATAKKSDVLRLWSGLGYNRRALFLQRCAQEIVEAHKGKFPQTLEELKKLPGIGEYTSRAVLCFAFDHQVAVVDTNVRKVILSEFFKNKNLSEKEIQLIADQMLPEGKAYLWNQALMDYSAMVLKKEKIPMQKQSKFLGSNRYYRGQIIKHLLQEERLSVDELSHALQKDRNELIPIIEKLREDGFVNINNGIVSVRQ